ncbi:hypothetical protein VPH35_090132 [Triticum aestivum]
MEGRQRGGEVPGDYVGRRKRAHPLMKSPRSPCSDPQVAASREPDPMSRCTRIIGPDHMTDALELVPPSSGPCAAVRSLFPTSIGAQSHRYRQWRAVLPLRDLRDCVSGLGLRPVSPGAGVSPFCLCVVASQVLPLTSHLVSVQECKCNSGWIDPCDFGRSFLGLAFMIFIALYEGVTSNPLT